MRRRMAHDPLAVGWLEYRRARPTWRLGHVAVGSRLVRFPDPSGVSRYRDDELERLWLSAKYVTLGWSAAVGLRPLFVASLAIAVTLTSVLFQFDIGPAAVMVLVSTLNLAVLGLVCAFTYSVWRESRLHVIELLAGSYEKELDRRMQKDPTWQVGSAPPARFMVGIGAFLLTSVKRRKGKMPMP